MAAKAEGVLRQTLAEARAVVPADINLEMAKYLNDRGNKKLKFRPELEFKDPFANQDLITPAGNFGLVCGWLSLRHSG